MTATRSLTPLDRVLADVQNALDTVFGTPWAQRPNPGANEPEVVLDEAERRHAAGLMRINHVGEVCAQALYVGQAAVARDAATRAHLAHAAQEETDHLAWCAQRLDELDSRPSLLNPLWYAGSYAIGALAGLRGPDRGRRDRPEAGVTQLIPVVPAAGRQPHDLRRPMRGCRRS